MASMTTPTTVSVVIPVFNGAGFLAEAILSALSQSHRPIECIVVDDGSTDATPEAVREFGRDVTYLRQQRAGVSVARNRGTALARGHLIAFLDHDDAWLPGKLERQLDLLERTEVPIALCATTVVDARGHALGTKHLGAREDLLTGRAREDLLTGMLMFDGTETVSCSSTGVVVRDALVACGGFDPALSTSADWDLLFRMLLEGPVAYVDEPLVLYRVHDENMSRSVRVMERDMRHAFDKAFADPRLPLDLYRRRRRAYARLYRMLAGSYRDSGEMPAAFHALGRAVVHDPSIVRELVQHAAGRPRLGPHRSATD
jgi:glycosyltransferase involved in cell wall biosynthesis